MNKLIAVIILFLIVPAFAQTATYYKTTSKKNFHYIEIIDNIAIVYQMGMYVDKAGIGPAVLYLDTLTKKNNTSYQGKIYTLNKINEQYILQNDKVKELKTILELEINKVNRDLNHAYCVKSYIDLSEKLNKEFPLFHFSFRTGYAKWKTKSNQTILHQNFALIIDDEIKVLDDSISSAQKRFTKTTNFILNNKSEMPYDALRDSIGTLPITWKPQSGYFDTVVYQLSKENPEIFYKLMEDFPSSFTFMKYAVNHDKELMKKLKQVEGHDESKKRFFKDHTSMKRDNKKIVAACIGLPGTLFLIDYLQK